MFTFASKTRKSLSHAIAQKSRFKVSTGVEVDALTMQVNHVRVKRTKNTRPCFIPNKIFALLAQAEKMIAFPVHLNWKGSKAGFSFCIVIASS